MVMLLLRCPKCGHDMKYNSASVILAKKRKECVYCGFSFDISTHILRRI